MKKIYLVLGEGNVGKSTLVRSLTGVARASRIPIRQTTNTDINLWTWVRSIQEDPEYMSPQQLLNEITKPSENPFQYYLIPLRITGINKCLGGQEYINLLAAHCIIAGAVVLKNDAIPHQLIFPQIQPLNIFNSKTIPSNEVANTVRNAWGWV